MNFWQDKKVLVTGGAGSIGSYLVELLVEQGAKTTVVDNLESGRKENLSSVLENIELIVGDLRDRTVADEVTRDRQIVFDLAGKAYGVGYSGAHHAQMLVSNVLINANVLQSSCENGVERYLVVSSSCVYPDDAPTPTPELDVNVGYPEKVNEGYGWAKRFAEIQARHFVKDFPKTKIAIARPSNAYGGTRFHLEAEKAHVIPALIRKILDDQNPLAVWGSGDQTRNFIHVVDVARAFMLLVEKYPVQDPVNIGTEQQTSIKELVYKLLQLTGKEHIRVIFDKTKPEGRKHKGVDVAKLKSLGFEPIVQLEEGLSEMIESCRCASSDQEATILMQAAPPSMSKTESLKKG